MKLAFRIAVALRIFFLSTHCFRTRSQLKWHHVTGTLTVHSTQRTIYLPSTAVAQQSYSCLDLLSVAASRSHADSPHSVGPL